MDSDERHTHTRSGRSEAAAHENNESHSGRAVFLRLNNRLGKSGSQNRMDRALQWSGSSSSFVPDM